MEHRHWHLKKDEQGVVWLSFDKAGESANTFDEGTLLELDQIVALLSHDTCKGLVITSAKKSGYIAGANLERASKVTDETAAFEFIRSGQLVFNKIEQLPFPTVAMISGFCLGGGMEMALACRYRIASIDPKTRLGLPEVLLGIHPGWGGTVRLLEKLSVFKAMDLMLTGRTLNAESAFKMGLVDAAVPERQLESVAKQYLLTQPGVRSLGFASKVLLCLKPLLYFILKRQLEKKIDSALYPAPFALLENFKKRSFSREKNYLAEAHSVAKLLLTPTSKSLMRVFFLREVLRSAGKKSVFKMHHVHVIGAGTMGGDIAAWCAFSGFRVTLQDNLLLNVAKSKQRAFDLFQKKCSRDRLAQTNDRLIVDIQGEHLSKADVVIEAVFEDLLVKQTLLKTIEQKLKPGAVLATNTSSIPLEELQSVLLEPSRLIGIHFFNPVSKMPLVEVIRSEHSDPEMLAKAFSFVAQIDRLPLSVKSSPGFLVNRILLPYLMEAIVLLDEGVSMKAIDRAATDFGMPMGPIELADTIGLDVCLSVAKNFQKHFQGALPNVLLQKVESKDFGRKSGQGFYTYKNGKKVASPGVSLKITKSEGLQDSLTLQQRLIYRMLNEAVACLDEGIVASADDLDAGLIFGTGFAPCRGGPIHYINSLGRERCIEELNMVERFYGSDFQASQGWAKKELFLSQY